MKINKIDDYIADKLSSFMSTMTLFWLLLILDVLGAIFDPPSSLQGWLLWGVSILFQSVALPVLALVQNKQTDRIENLLNEIHTASMEELKSQDEEFKDIKDMMTMLKDEISLERDDNAEIHAILSNLTLILHKLHIEQEGEK